MQKQLIEYEESKEDKDGHESDSRDNNEKDSKIKNDYFSSEPLTILEQLNAMRAMKEGPNWGMDDFYVDSKKRNNDRRKRRKR